MQVFLDGHHPITETGFDTAQDLNDLQFELYEYLSATHSLEATNGGFKLHFVTKLLPIPFGSWKARRLPIIDYRLSIKNEFGVGCECVAYPRRQ